MTTYPHFVSPKVYFVGHTSLNMGELKRYLADTNQEEFLKEVEQALAEGISEGEILCSFYAKLCYASLSLGKNQNITKVRSIADNIEATISSGHGSVFEHVSLNFVVHDCSRVYTHEQVRHRVGTAYSQTSGRYVRTDHLNIVVDPILEPAYDLVEEARGYLETWYAKVQERLNINGEKDFTRKKKLTSAMRRLLPNGQANELGFSVNLRSARHIIALRTSAHAEWEIRVIYQQVFELLRSRYPAMFADAIVEDKDGLPQVSFENPKI